MTGFAHLICDFAPASPGFVKCKRCSQTIAHGDPNRPPRFACRKQPARPTVRAASAPAESFEPTPPESLPCIHRGEVTRQEKCRRESCKGGVLFDVLACAQFGECSIDPRAVRGLHVCKSCKARTPSGGEPVGLTPATATPRERLKLTQRPTADVAVVIPCHNYGRYLAEAVDSVLAQSVRAAEIVVVDDSSTDDSASIAARYAEAGVRYLRVDVRSAHLARAAGFKATTSPWLCFLDADDRLSPDYLKAGLALVQPGVGIIYSPMVKEGDETGPVPLTTGDITAQNFIHAGAIVSRVALESTQAFDAVLPRLTLEDWFTWRQIMAAGWRAIASPATYHYRRHAGSRSEEIGRYDYFTQRGIELDDVTIVLPLSGRSHLWPQMTRWLLDQTWPRSQTRLLVLDSSNDPAFAATVRNWLATCPFAGFQYIPLTVGERGLADGDRHQEHIYRGVQRAMPRLYNRVRQEVTSPWVAIIEDDITPPADAIPRLLRSFNQHTISVSGVYQSPYSNTFLAWDKAGQPFTEPGQGVVEVGGNGFGCVVLRRSTFTQTVTHHGGLRGDFDPNFYADLPPGSITKLDWSVVCEHSPRAV